MEKPKEQDGSNKQETRRETPKADQGNEVGSDRPPKHLPRPTRR